MGRGSADETIVVVKLFADEDAVTYLRRKRTESSMDAGGEGWNTIPSVSYFKITDSVRSAKTELSGDRDVLSVG